MITKIHQLILNSLSGEFFVVLMVFWCAIETLLILFKNRDYILAKFDKGERNIKSQVDKYSSRALTFVAIIFALISLMIAGFGPIEIQNVKDTFLVFTFGLAFFIISYKLSVISATKRIYWDLQQRLFNFGVLSLVFGLLLFFKNHISQFFVFILLTTLIIIVLHIREYVSDLKYNF